MFVRLYSGSDGQSHFEDLDASEGSTLFSNIHSASDIVFRSNLAPRTLDWHTPRRRRYVIMLSGSMDIRVGYGTAKTFEPGDVLLAEDLTGQGHVTVSKGNMTRAFVHLA